MKTAHYVHFMPTCCVVNGNPPNDAGSTALVTNLFKQDTRFESAEAYLEAALDSIQQRFGLTQADWASLRDEFEGMTVLIAQGYCGDDEVQFRIVSVDSKLRYHLHRYWRFGSPQTTELSLSRDLSRSPASMLMIELLTPLP